MSTQVRPLPRPRNFDDVVERLEGVERGLRSVTDGQLAMSQQMGTLAAEVGRLRASGTAPLPPYRNPESSYTDLDPVLAEYRRTLRDKVKDPQTRFDSERARAEVKGAIERARADEAAAKWEAGKKLAWKVLVAVVVALVLEALAHFGVHP